LSQVASSDIIVGEQLTRSTIKPVNVKS